MSSKAKPLNRKEYEHRLTKAYRAYAVAVREQADFVQDYADDLPLYENGTYGAIGKRIDDLETEIAEIRKALGYE